MSVAPEEGPGSDGIQNAVGPVVATAAQRAEWAAQADQAGRRLVAAGVTIVALSWVDNAGITRVKTVPLGRLERAAGWGVGMSPIFDVFLVNDDITTSKHIGGPGGDLRLIPDTDRITALAALPGWAWAPVDRYTQDGRVYAGCQRSFARRLTGQDSGAGRLPEPAAIFAVATRLLARGALGPDLAGRRVVVSAGGTREEIDPVRFIGNWSTGTQGYALARTAVARGAEVILVAANVALPDPGGNGLGARVDDQAQTAAKVTN